MKKTIFSKYSNDRADKYKILTKIVEDEGVLRVEKLPLTESAKLHVNNIYDWYKKLSAICDDTQLLLNSCEIINDIAVFEYIDGKTLDRIMLDMYQDGDIEGLYGAFDKFVDTVMELATEDFVPSEEFKAVFGDESFDTSVKSMKVTDVDMILGNVLVKDGQWHLIDYEWTFDFKIPVRFVIYRCIAAFLNTLGNYGGVECIDLYSRLDMSEKERQSYDRMETSFQSYVKAGYHSLGNMYEAFGKKNISVWNAVDADNLKMSLEQLKIDHEKARCYGEAKEAEVRAINDELISANEQIKRLTEENNTLNNTINDIYNSKKWRLATKLAKLCTGGK